MTQSEYKFRWPLSRLGHLGQKFRSLGQIIENHLVHIWSNFFHTQAYYLKVKVPEYLNFTSKIYVKVFQELLIAKPDDGSGSCLA